MFTIGLVQANAIGFSNRIDKIKDFIYKSKNYQCQALCFPEAYLTGYLPESAETLSISKDSDLLEQISVLAIQHNIDLLIGFMEKDANNYYLTHGLFTATGKSYFYRKTHLGKKERLFFSPGNSLDVFPLSNGLKIGICLCVETHFPEILQTLSLKGADIVFAPHAVPRVAGNRKELWQKYIPARSYDNRIVMACCNLWDETHFAGGCFATDPRGNVLLSSFEEKEHVAFFSIDETALVKGKHYFPKDRRTELYL